jgi:4-hydroxy-3-methylbut-2-en-1-yl diphosphate synthase IspG/GcpE
MLEMTYNSTRDDLSIPEYGRTIHQMVSHLKSLADREERNRCAVAIVSIMGSIVAQEGDKDDAEKKLWGQLFYMADYDLDVDCP